MAKHFSKKYGNKVWGQPTEGERERKRKKTKKPLCDVCDLQEAALEAYVWNCCNCINV